MAINAKEAKGNNSFKGGMFGPQEALEPGGYPARLVQVIDLGLQPQQPFKGQEKAPAQTLRVIYELLDEFVTDNREDSDTKGEELEDKPRWVWEQFALLNLEADRAKSTKRYVALDPNLEHDGDWGALIGTPCTVVLTKKPTKEKGVFRNYVGDVTTMRGKDAKKAPELKNPSVVFDLDDEDCVEVMKGFAPWLQEIIEDGLEFESSAVGKVWITLSDEEKKPAEEEEGEKPKAKKEKKPVEQPKEEVEEEEDW